MSKTKGMRLSGLGAAATVLGSKALLETDRSRSLVDCGFAKTPASVR